MRRAFRLLIMADCHGSDDSSVIDIDDAPPASAPPKHRRKRLKPPSERAILEQGEDRDFRKPPAAAVKCHILGVAVLHDLLKHFERSQCQPLAHEARRQVEQLFNSAANFVLSTFLTPPPPFTAHYPLRPASR